MAPKTDPYAALPDVEDPYAALPDADAPPRIQNAQPTAGYFKRLADWGQKRFAPDPALAGKLSPFLPQAAARAVAGATNTGNAEMRTLTSLPAQIANSHPIDSMVEGMQSVLHPIEAHRKAAQEMLARGQGGDTYDPQTRTGVVQPGAPAPKVNYDEDVPDTVGPALANTLVAETGMRAASKVLKKVPSVTPGALKEKARLAAKSLLGADKTVARDAVKAAAEKAGKDKLDIARANRDAEKAHTATVADVERENAKTTQVHADRHQTQTDLDESGRELDKKVAAAEKKADTDNTALWNSLRQKIGNASTNINRLKQVVKAAAKSADPMSPGSGGSSLFRSILGEGAEFDDAGRPVVDGEPRIVTADDGHELKPGDEGYDREYENWYGEPPPLGDQAGAATYNRLQRWYSFISDKMYGHGRIESGTWDALKRVRTAINDSMQAIAKENNAEKELADARTSHQRMMETFRDSTREERTNATKMLDETATEHRKAEAKAERLRKVAQYDPSIASLATHIENLKTGLNALPAKAPFREQVEVPPAKPERQVFHKPTVDIGAENLNMIEKKAKSWKSLSKRDLGMIAGAAVARPIVSFLTGHDIGILPLASTAAFEGVTRGLATYAQMPGVAEWFAQPAAGEIEALRKIPGADRVKIVNGLTGVAVQAAKQGKLTRLAPQVAELLGSSNARMVADAIAASRPQNAGEAKKKVAALRGQP